MKSKTTALHLMGFILNILMMVLVVFVVIQLAAVAYNLGYRVFTEPAMDESPGRDVMVEVDQNMSDWDLGIELEEKGLVENHLLFTIQLKLSSYKKDIKPGLYTLNTSMTAKELMQVMAKEENEEIDE
ncbi:endolytic transglycosylase MltG [Roseburia sp. MSJ-14]|uniref:endolytic transglycosylase MltG n=1 Tax=Roseburia sp. MSJ-14 TaxID=2841514 RepID=UPI001C0FE02D|nr:endolytic transglycosylase MltG [Roseburia sp. MSJ-14]MBU5472544.1 endolytic transglycosylase MltG [Roseburia sp. MSJ-14]